MGLIDKLNLPSNLFLILLNKFRIVPSPFSLTKKFRLRMKIFLIVLKTDQHEIGDHFFRGPIRNIDPTPSTKKFIFYFFFQKIFK